SCWRPWGWCGAPLLSAGCSTNGAEVIGAVGSSITFHLRSLEGGAAAWSFRDDVIAVVLFGDPPEATFFDDGFKPRLAFPGKGSALTISRLRLEDAGTYTAKSLQVPAVTCAVRNCSAGICRYALRCAASGAGAGNVSYTWSVGSARRHGAVVLVEESALDEPLLTCTAQNPVSSRNVTVASPGSCDCGRRGGCIWSAFSISYPRDLL
uniref:Ig-like domain-containing protein n=1 Tax=Amazona collaria TaxID=241587 RepID=A0A8B9G5P7_9PSIT